MYACNITSPILPDGESPKAPKTLNIISLVSWAKVPVKTEATSASMRTITKLKLAIIMPIISFGKVFLSW